MKRLVLAILVVIVFAGVAIAAIFPRQTTLPVNDRWSGEYRSLGLVDDNSLFGYRYFRFVVDMAPDGRWEIENRGDAYNPIVGYYPNGAIRMKGTCSIQGRGFDMYPLIDDLDTATFFRPDGSIAASIENGTGSYLLFNADGTLQWSAEYNDHEKLWWKKWNPDGTLASESGGTP